MVRRTCIAGSTLNPVGYKILIEVLDRGKVGSIAEVGYVFCKRHQGKSKVIRQAICGLSAPPGTVAPCFWAGRTVQSAYREPSWSVHPLWFSGSIGSICRYGAAILAE